MATWRDVNLSVKKYIDSIWISFSRYMSFHAYFHG